MAVQGVAHWSQICSLNVAHWSGIGEKLVRVWSVNIIWLQFGLALASKLLVKGLVRCWSSFGQVNCWPEIGHERMLKIWSGIGGNRKIGQMRIVACFFALPDWSQED